MDSNEAPISLPAKDAAAYLGVSVRQFHLLRSEDPAFPKPVLLGGPRSSRWIRTELADYVATRPRVTREEPPQLAAARAARATGHALAPAPFGGLA